MVQYRWLRGAALAGVLMIPILTAGCGLFAKPSSNEIDPPQDQVQQAPDTNDSSSSQAPIQGEDTQMTVYLQDRYGYLAPIALRTTLGAEEEAGRKALEMMVMEGSYSNQLPEDFQGMLPKGTQIKSFTINPENKLATVDFSALFSEYNPTDERKILESITWTLTAMTGVEGVVIQYEGKPLTEMPQAGFPLDKPLTRSMGINLEAAEGIDYSQSTAVTLYFSAQTMLDEPYYVPVTRLVDPTSTSKEEAVLAQLIAGPLDTSDLTGVITPDVQVTGIDEQDGIVTVNLEDQAYEAGQKLPDEMLQAVVLSITENTDADKVQININGESNVFSEPVGRPHHLNSFKS